MKELKFQEDAEPIALSDDFFYMINDGGWCAPETFLWEEDARRVRKAIELIEQYREQGIEKGFFEEM